ncbi:MAG: ABC transporter substrate-binding protein [candidate division NC10 bacterium]|nr:ABC transporter substrate-binding protein [candidate division NC10 bacterium]
MDRGRFGLIGIGCWALLGLGGVAASAEAASEVSGRTQAVAEGKVSRITIGLARHSVFSLPIYLTAQQTARSVGLTVDVVSFGGGSRVAAALASDSLEVATVSLDVLVGLINAGQPVQAFYAGVFHPLFEWFARPPIRGWGDLRGRSIAISTFGSSADFLTRHVMRKHGLTPGQDVHLVQAGELANGFAALRAGRVDAALLAAPFTWSAEELGFTRLGSQATEVAETWPRNVFVAKQRMISGSPHTLQAFLRAYVEAIRLARTNRNVAVQTMQRELKLDPRHAERAYAEVMAGFDERGRLPTKVMPLFWQIAVAAGDVTEPWPEARFFDRRFLDTFDEWAPK